MKTKKQIFHLRKPQADPYLVKMDFPTDSDPAEHLILWTVKLYDHVLVMPELTVLVHNNYCLN